MGGALSNYLTWDDTISPRAPPTIEDPPSQHSGPSTFQGCQNFTVNGGTFIAQNIQQSGAALPQDMEQLRRILDFLSPLNFRSIQLNAQNTRQSDSALPQDMEHLRKILDFLSPLNFWWIQQENLSKWAPETLEWIRQSNMFQGWLISDGDILWGTGMPGAGKTILTSVMINHMQTLAKASSDICIAFVYCRYTEPLKVRDILAALLRQLLERFPRLLPLVEPLYATHVLEQTKPTQFELIAVIRDIYSRFRIGFLFIDGLDEAVYDEQFDLLDALKSVRANVFITSRPLVRLKDVLPNVTFFDITAREEDIECLVSQHISRNPYLIQLLAAEGQRQAVIKKICKSSYGMFLYASLMVEVISDCTSWWEVMDQLGKLDVTESM